MTVDELFMSCIHKKENREKNRPNKKRLEKEIVVKEKETLNFFPFGSVQMGTDGSPGRQGQDGRIADGRQRLSLKARPQ